MPKRDPLADMVKEIHTAIVGTPDGKVKGLRATVESIEDRHKTLDEGKRVRQVVGAIKHGATLVAGAVAGYLSGHK